jgi:prepilin-type processing-associated H-X9-DG protein
VNIQGTTNSILKSFRGNKTYVDQNGQYPEPEEDEDWLWYYRIGDVPFYESTTDLLGNIAMLDGHARNTVVGNVDSGLMCYGNVMTDITVDATENTITFEYVVGAHLKATLASVETDSDNNAIYCYNNFQYDASDSLHGVNHVETYRYEPDGELDELAANNPAMFDQYIGRTEPVESDMADFIDYGSMDISYKYLKCSFTTSGNVMGAATYVDGQLENYRYIKSDYYARTDSDTDSTTMPTFKKDWLVGITYNPAIRADVYIDRGNAASWERHIKLGEVKTFDDIQNYANGGFFNIR